MRGKAIFGAAVLAGASYWPGSRLALDPALLVAWKGAGVGLLALWAALCVPARTGRLLAIVLALGAAGDVLLAAVSLEVGAVAFLAGHVVAIRLYLTNRRRARAGCHFLPCRRWWRSRPGSRPIPPPRPASPFTRPALP